MLAIYYDLLVLTFFSFCIPLVLLNARYALQSSSLALKRQCPALLSVEGRYMHTQQQLLV